MKFVIFVLLLSSSGIYGQDSLISHQINFEPCKVQFGGKWNHELNYKLHFNKKHYSFYPLIGIRYIHRESKLNSPNLEYKYLMIGGGFQQNLIDMGCFVNTDFELQILSWEDSRICVNNDPWPAYNQLKEEYDNVKTGILLSQSVRFGWCPIDKLSISIGSRIFCQEINDFDNNGGQNKIYLGLLFSIGYKFN